MIGPHQVAARWLRRHAFVARPVRRIGAEAELIVHDAATLRPAPLQGDNPSILPFLHDFARVHGWSMTTSEKGAPRLRAPDGASIALEPGGQIEYATRPHTSLGALHDDLASVLGDLTVLAVEHGLTLTAAGVDPHNDVSAAPLLIDADRYRQMDAYFAGIGPAGARMMRQTAALQINIDVAEPQAVWRALNAASPILVAAFANSRHYAGRDTGYASYRAETWRHVDPLRTGVLADGPPAEEYAAFALRAPAMLLPHGLRAVPFVEHWRLGATAHDWRTHLTTLFPEVRPRGYLEVRSIDAQPADMLAGPLLFVSTIAWDPVTREAVRELVGEPDPSLLARAARHGTGDPQLAALVADTRTIVHDGARRLGIDHVGVLERTV